MGSFRPPKAYKTAHPCAGFCGTKTHLAVWTKLLIGWIISGNPKKIRCLPLIFLTKTDDLLPVLRGKRAEQFQRLVLDGLLVKHPLEGVIQLLNLEIFEVGLGGKETAVGKSALDGHRVDVVLKGLIGKRMSAHVEGNLLVDIGHLCQLAKIFV